MSQSPSPFSIQDPSPRQQPGGSRNTIVIVAIISLTLLLMCGGVVGLGIYAVDRLADQMMDFDEEAMGWDDEDAEFAIEFALDQNESIRESVGEIEEVRSNEELTYHDDADMEDYYYDIQGTKGTVVVVIDFDDDNDERWFKSVELVDGSNIDSPRTSLEVSDAPFDSKWSKQVYDILSADNLALANSLGVGSVKWITYDFEASDERQIETELVFHIRGDSGTESVMVDFQDFDFTEIRSIHVIDDIGERQRLIYSAEEETEAVEPEGEVNE